MLFASQNTRAARLEICKGCEHFNKSTRSCGTLLKKKKVKGGTLCGCFMPAKASLKSEACPIGKWGPTVNPQDLAEIREFVNSLENFISRDQNEKLVEMYNRTYGTNEVPSNCSSCVRGMIENLKKTVNADTEAYIQRETERVYRELDEGPRNGEAVSG